MDIGDGHVTLLAERLDPITIVIAGLVPAMTISSAVIGTRGTTSPRVTAENG
jgi:hypothetical protein